MKIIIGVGMLFIAFTSLTCDICNMSVSLSPDDTKNYISILYRNRYACKNFTKLMYRAVPIESISRHSGVVLLPTMEDQKHEEMYSVYELKGFYNFNSRFQATISLPFIQNIREINDNKQFQLDGMGDPILVAKYHLLRTNYEDKANHRFTIGTGVKMPFGKFNFEKDGEYVNHDIQAGTGTLDFVFTMDYLYKRKHSGLMLSVNYKANTKNEKVNYIFGNTINSTMNFFYMKKLKENITLVPYLGSYFEQAEMDVEDFIKEENTGGDLVFGTIGLQFFVKDIKIEGMYQHTLLNKLNGDIQLDTKNRFEIGVSFLF